MIWTKTRTDGGLIFHDASAGDVLHMFVMEPSSPTDRRAAWAVLDAQRIALKEGDVTGRNSAERAKRKATTAAAKMLRKALALVESDDKHRS